MIKDCPRVEVQEVQGIKGWVKVNYCTWIWCSFRESVRKNGIRSFYLLITPRSEEVNLVFHSC